MILVPMAAMMGFALGAVSVLALTKWVGPNAPVKRPMNLPVVAKDDRMEASIEAALLNREMGPVFDQVEGLGRGV